MNKILKSFFVLAMFLGVGISANAQQGAQTNTSVTARILKQITFTAVDTIQFGTVAAGGGQTFLDPRSQSNSTNIGFNSRIGRLIINATAEEPVRVEFDETVTMRTSNASDSITYKPIISVIRENKGITDADRTASVLLSDDAIAAPANDVTGPNGTGEGPFGLITTDAADDESTLYLGGYLYLYNTTNPIPQAGPTGTFRGTLNFNVLYAN